MSLITVGVGDCKLTRDTGSALITHALGSCIAVVVHDPLAGVGGLLHYMLPESSIDRAKAEQNPWMFADTGIPLLFQTAFGMGAQRRSTLVWAFGGAQMVSQQGIFNIGKRNHLAMRKLLWKTGVLLRCEEVGGSLSRSVRLDMSTGKIWMKMPGDEQKEIGGGGAAVRR